jgi:hypothetical protein
MPRYHFDLVDHTTVSDQGGQLLTDDDLAIQVADRLAAEILEARPELQGKNYKVVVTDADGDEIHVSPLDRIRLVG